MNFLYFFFSLSFSYKSNKIITNKRKTVPYKMLSSVGTFYPQWDTCKVNQFKQEYEQQIYPNNGTHGTRIHSNTTYGNWIPSLTDKLQNRSFTIRSQFDQSAHFNATNIQNDENDGTVFGWTQHYYDTAQHGWV